MYKKQQDKKKADQAQTTKKAPKYKLAAEPYTDSETGVYVYYPEGWTVTKGGADEPLVTVTNPTPDKTDAGTPFPASMNLVAGESTSGLTLETLTTETIVQLKKAYPDYTVIESRTTKTAAGTAIQIIDATFTQEGVKIRILQGIIVGDATYGALSAGALASAWDYYKDVYLEAMLK